MCSKCSWQSNSLSNCARHTKMSSTCRASKALVLRVELQFSARDTRIGGRISVQPEGPGALGKSTIDSSESESRSQVDTTSDLEREFDTVHNESDSMIIDPEPPIDNNLGSSNAGIHWQHDYVDFWVMFQVDHISTDSTYCYM